MLQYSIDSAREDGTPNCVILNGVTGFIGRTNVRLTYMNGGCIRLKGANNYEFDGWQRISEFFLSPGKYCFTGIKGQEKESVALQLVLEDGTSLKRSYYQYDGEVPFLIDKDMNATLYVRVYPSIGEINVTAKPAVYKNE